MSGFRPWPAARIWWLCRVLGSLALAVCSTNAGLASLCGPLDDTQDVELYDGSRGPSKEAVNTWQPPIGLLRWNLSFIPPLSAEDDPGNIIGVRWCTGTLFSENLLLTAGNCMDVQVSGWRTPGRRIGSSMVALPPQELASLMHVSFNYQRDATTCGNPAEPRTCAIRKPTDYPVVRLLEYRRGNLDYAILELGPGADGQLPGKHYSPANPDTSTAALAQANLLTIIQHANAGPKRIAAGKKLKITNDRISYGDIDTFGGSAGAGILDQSGRLIGLHTDGGCSPAGGDNSGITMRALAQASEIIR
jgi:Trypsin-like peptidase domain